MATFSPLDAARYLGLEGVLIATSHFPGIQHLKRAKKNLKPPFAQRVKLGGGGHIRPFFCAWGECAPLGVFTVH